MKEKITARNSERGMYGLPLKVEFCKKCVISNQRPSSVVEFKNKPGDKKNTISFDSEGVCDACRFAERKSTIDWNEREKQLKDLLNRFRSKDGRYDVVVPGSGGKDSIKVAWLLKYKYGMHPLLVTWPPHLYTPMGRRNFDAWLNAGFDNITYTPNQKVHRLLTKFAFLNLANPFQPFIIGQKNLAPKVSVQHRIPLVMYGENQAEYGNPIRDNETPKQNPAFYSSEEKLDEIYLGGISARELMKEHGLVRGDLEPYLPVDPSRMQENGTEFHYFGYYVNWDPMECYYFAVENTDFYPNDERTPGGWGKYSSIDDKIDWLHFYTTFVKFGIGRATHDAAQEIRNNHITRDEGVRLVRRFDGEFPYQYFEENLAYMGISKEAFFKKIDEARPPHLWKRVNGSWELKHCVE